MHLEIILVPCNYLHTSFGYTGDSIHADCIANRQAQVDYLGALNLIFYHTEEIFNSEEYGESSI